MRPRSWGRNASQAYGQLKETNMQDQTQTMLDDGFGNIHLPRPTPLWINTLHYFFFRQH